MRMIDEDKLIEESESGCWDIDLKELQMILKYVPTIDAAPVMHGEWVTTRTIIHDGELYCSLCGQEALAEYGRHTYIKSNYCPNCGAKMEELHAQLENKPLTLDELREMGGEPVYIDDWFQDSHGWELSDVAEDYFDERDVAQYGSQWVAYRYKPKEVWGMNVDEIVRATRALAVSRDNQCDNDFVPMAGKKVMLNIAADLIESLQAQLIASQRREKAAVEFIKYLDRNYSGYMAEDERFSKWRGTQEAEKGESNV